MKKFILLVLIVSISFANPATIFIQTVLADIGGKTVDDFSQFYTLSDPNLLNYVEDNVYSGLVESLNSENYFVENVEAIYISKEFLEEVAFNSQANVFFGYTLAELDEQFQGKRYIFTLGDDGTTVVQEFEAYDDTYERAIRNVAIGSGVIFLCVTISVVSGGLGAPAVSAIFMASAKTGAEFALFSGALSGVSSGIVTGIQTGDFSEALKAAALNGSESFKWGAISGALSGGTSELIGLHGATLNGLSMDQAAIIQKESKWPLDVIKNLHSVEEYTIYQEAGLSPMKIGKDTWALVKEIDWNFTDDMGRTNIMRVNQGFSPLDIDGNSIELHHIGQKADSPIAFLSKSDHIQNGHNNILHWAEEGKGVPDDVWNQQRREFWLQFMRFALGG